MSDTATPADKVVPSRPLSDRQIGDAVASKFLTEVNQAMTVSPTDTNANSYDLEQSAWVDLRSLNGDPLQKTVINAIANKIENHDAVLGIVQGRVERNGSGDIEAFRFNNPDREQEFQNSIIAYEQLGHTRKEAEAAQGFDFKEDREATGHIVIYADGKFHAP